MKKATLLISCVFVFGNLFSQRNKNNTTSGFITCSEFHITQPLTEIFKNNPVDEDKIYNEQESEDRENRKPQRFLKTVEKDGPAYGNDVSTIQKQNGYEPGRSPITNWNGQAATGFRPMDPSGAAGPNNYVQMINSTTFKIYNKTTGAVTLTGTLGNLWSPATGNAGDPIVLYDKAADRWFLAQFGTNTDKKIYIAISVTSDPAGAYYTYTYTSPLFPDYLKFSVWQDGYYMTSNQSTQKVFAFERTAMLAGNSASRAVYQTFSPPNAGYFFVPLPGDASDGTMPTAGTPCPIFSYSDNGWGGSYIDAVNIYQMAVNWIPTTPTATITLSANLPTAAFDGSYDVNWDDVSQPGTTQKLDGIGGTLMYRAQWKSWSGYNTIVLNWSVKISATQRSIKWCELRQNQSTGVWSIYQEGIYQPDTDTRWMGSIAMDNSGNIALAYMKSNSTTHYPGLYYAGRRACDPLGTLPVSETTAIAGAGSQTGINRDGDYADLTLDPDGVTFWHTSEYMGASGVAKTQIFSFQLTPCSVASVAIAQTAGSNPECAGATATFTATPTNGGTTPVYQWKINGVNAGTNSPTFTSTLTTGQMVTCVMTSNLSGVTGSPATSNPITMTVNATVTPAVSIALTSGNNPECAGASATFTATPTNGGTTPSYQWQIAGVNAGTNAATFTTTALTNGQIVTCILTSNATCASTTTATSNGITMNVSTTVTPAVSIALTSGNNPECAGASATFTATPTNGGTTPSYQWQIAGVNAGTNAATFTTTALTNGQSVTCIMTSNATCASTTTATSNGITMTVNTTVTPAVSIALTSGNNPECAGASATFTATPANGGTTPSYQWQIAGVNAGTNAATFTTTALTNGQIVTCIMTGNATCASTTTATSNGITMTVNACGTVPVANFTSTATTICAGSSVTFTDLSTNTPTSWAWTFTGGTPATSSAQNPTILYSAGGTYQVSLTATNGSGSNTKTVTGYIVVYAAHPLTPGVITGPVNGLCPAGTSTATYSIAAVANTTSYTWTTPTGITITSGQGTNAINVNIGSTFVSGNISVVAVNVCGASAAKTLALKSVPAAPTVLTGNSSGLCLAGLTSATYTTTAVTGATSYVWVAPNGATIASGQGTTSVVVNFGGTFTSGNITVAATNACGTSATKVLALKSVLAAPGVITGPAIGLCSGGLSSANYSIAAVSGATSYTWAVPTGATITAGQGTTGITVSFGNTFVSGNVSVMAVNACGNSPAKLLAIKSVPSAPVSIVGTSGICANQQNVSYSTAAVTGATSYTWTVPAGATIASGQGTNAVVVNWASTAGNICVTANDACGQGAVRCLLCNFICIGTINNNGLRELTTMETGTMNFTIYPNPASDDFTIEINNIGNPSTSIRNRQFTAEVYSVYGTLVIRKNFEVTEGENSLKVQLGDNNSGIYFVRLLDQSNNEMFKRTVIKQ